MEFEGHISENPRIPKGLLVRDGKPKGPFAIQGNAKEIAEKIGWKYIRVPTGLGFGWSYYVIPLEMNENFEMVHD